MRRTLTLLLLTASTGLLDRVPVYAQQPYDSAFFSGMSYRNVGPVRGGRSITSAGSVARPMEYWFGATGGGVWKTTDGGTTWRPMSDKHFTSSSVGAVDVCDADPDIVYVGMGEVQLRGNIMQGDGAYRTTDGGKTWSKIGLEESQAIGRIRIHPTNCDVAYAAVLGHPYGPHPERGVFKTTDAGKTWSKVLFRNAETGAVDLIMDPSNPDVLYASLWDVERTPWSLESGGPGSGLFKSTDGGTSWTELTRNPGLPTGTLGKIGVTVSGADPNRVWAIIEAEEGGVFRSDDGGATWERTNDERKLRQRAFYYTRIYADPKDRDVVYVLNVGFFRSKDGGKTFPQQIRVPHGDNHDLWIAPDDPKRMIQSNDGGANVSVNGGQTWTEQDYPTAQLYRITTTNHVPYWVCGAQQDNSTACMPSAGWRQMAPHVAVGGGESGYIASDPEDPDVFYAGSYGGHLTRFDYRTGISETINVWPENPMGQSASDITERFQWTFPIVFSRTGPKTLFVGSQHVWKTTNGGKSWERMSPDLTRHDPKTMGPSGGPITKDQTGVETYATIFTIAPSPHDANVIWTGSDDGLVHITRDGGRTWTNVTPPSMPEFTRVSLIDVSPHQPGKAYLAGKRYQLDDRAPYAYVTTDYGATWKPIVNGIAPGHYVHAVREDPARPGLLFAGTEHGVYVSFDDGARWTPFNRNLPDVQVPDLVVHGNDLVIGTHGRSAYIMDDITPLRQISPRVAGAKIHVFEPAPARRNVDRGVTFSYYLAKPADRVTIEILDEAGSLVRRVEGKREEKKDTTATASEGDDEDGPRAGPTVPLKAGLNRFTWDTRHEGPTTFPEMILWAAGSNGPRALPGRYSVRITADKLPPVTRTFELRPDPRTPHVTMADLRAQHELAMQVRERTSQANAAVIRIRELRKEIDARVAKDRSLAALAEPLKARLAEVEGEIYQVRNRSNQDPLNFPIKLNNKIAALLGAVENVSGKPTAQSYVVFETLSKQLDAELQRLEAIVAGDLAAFNRAATQRGLKPVEAGGAR